MTQHYSVKIYITLVAATSLLQVQRMFQQFERLGTMEVADLQAMWGRLSELLKVDILSKLPVPLAQKVLSYLSVEEIVRCSRVSRTWYSRSCGDESLSIWRGFLDQQNEDTLVFAEGDDAYTCRELFIHARRQRSKWCHGRGYKVWPAMGRSMFKGNHDAININHAVSFWGCN